MKYSRVERYKELREEISKMDTYSFETPEETKEEEKETPYGEKSLNGEMADSLESLIRTKETYQNKRLRREMKRKYKAQRKEQRKKEDGWAMLRTIFLIVLLAIVIALVILVVCMIVGV